MLPKIDVPIYELNLISSGKKIRFRPFLVKEQKLLLMANQSDDPKESLNVVKQICKNCIIDEVDVESLPVFDLEFIFLNLRARSVSEVINLQYKCNNKKIMLSDKLGIMMRYPTFEMLANLKSKNENETLMELLTICVDNIFDQDNIYYAKDVTREELIDFIDNLQQKDLEKIQEFFETAPKIKKNIGFSCRKCGYKENIEVEGLQNFFI